MENKKRLFRHLKADELQIRPTDTQSKGKVSLLVYKDARVDMTVLDETFGPFNWSCDYKDVNGVTYCCVTIKDTNGVWVTKWDAGTNDNNFEQEKGTASDAFKRACFKFGLGRELYNIPRIRIQCPDDYYHNGKLTMSFSVKSIEFEDEKCVDLVIVDRHGNVVYDLNKPSIALPSKTDAPQEDASIPWEDRLKKWCGEQKGKADDITLLAFFFDALKKENKGNKYGIQMLWDWLLKDLADGSAQIDIQDPKHPLVIRKYRQ